MNINQCFISENEKFGHCLYQTIHFRYEQNQLAKRHLVKVPMTRNFDQHFLDCIANGMVHLRLDRISPNSVRQIIQVVK